MAEKINESHQRFIQVLLSHGIMEGSEIRALHRHCCEVHKVHYMHDKLDDFVACYNKHLQPLFMQIQKEWMKRMAKHIMLWYMELIILSDNGFAPSTDILNLADQLQARR
ncbi:hypothetical protein GDO86_017335 [Hymenochirus boettgeri]|uniref:Uncharacterized protein n=1 Tax=Hymenochirus boettgeri TaxID=247094 RepID=A0A8T2IPQ6_9PIPI|nr:hypothetical protein GDO86_017335 [Hymenochirus boettgeri]